MKLQGRLPRRSRWTDRSKGERTRSLETVNRFNAHNRLEGEHVYEAHHYSHQIHNTEKNFKLKKGIPELLILQLYTLAISLCVH